MRSSNSFLTQVLKQVFEIQVGAIASLALSDVKVKGLTRYNAVKPQTD